MTRTHSTPARVPRLGELLREIREAQLIHAEYRSELRATAATLADIAADILRLKNELRADGYENNDTRIAETRSIRDRIRAAHDAILDGLSDSRDPRKGYE